MANEDAKFTIDDHVQKALARLPSMHDDSTLLRGMLSIYSARIQILDNVLRGITADALFTISTAIGVQLDQIGTIIGIAREARNDVEYRIILRTQALLVLPERRTQARLMEIVRSLMDTDPGVIRYTQLPPKTYVLSIATASLSTLLSWVPILRRTRPASYVGILNWVQVGHFAYSNGNGAVPTVTESWEGYSNGNGAVPTVDEDWNGYSARIQF
jgi:hypothetical protein